jgi:hypothetical protein
VVEIAPLVKQVRTEAGAVDGFQELLRDDGVGIDIGGVLRDQVAFLYRNFFNDLFCVAPATRGGRAARAYRLLLFPTRASDDLPHFLHILADTGNGVAAGQGHDGQGGNDQGDGGFHIETLTC